MKSLAYLIIVCACGVGTCDSMAASRQAKLETWVSQDLASYVTQQLSTQPRFKDEAIRFVVYADGNPQAASSALALSIRDQLRDAVAEQPGLKIVWQRDPGHVEQSAGIDCTRDQAHYFVGIEVMQNRNGAVDVEVRAFDAEDQRWVTGFKQSWRGNLTSEQKRQLQQPAIDSSFRGMRDAPFNESQFDMLAAHLADELGCALLRQTAGEYVISNSADTVLSARDSKAEAAMLELVRNNLADFRAIQYSQDSNTVNAVLDGKAHAIDDELYQYWVTITPGGSSSELLPISAHAYIRIEDKYAVAAMIPSVSVSIAKSNIGFLNSMRIVELRDARLCASNGEPFGSSTMYNNAYSSSAADCYALEVEAHNDTVMFFLNHQLSSGLVRLSDHSCSKRTDARIVKSNERLHFPLPIDSLMSDSWQTVDGWQLNPDKDAYYVIAAKDTKAARALSQHIGRLPNRCSASVRRGLDGRELQQWMDRFAAIAKRWEASIDWQIVHVKNIY